MKRFDRILFFTGIIFSIYGLIVLLILGFKAIFNYFFLLLGLSFVLLPFVWNRIRKKIPLSIQRLLYLLLSICVLYFAITEIRICLFMNHKAESNADYVILLGSQIREDGPSLDFKARIDTAYEYLMENPSPLLIATGAKGYNEPISEAQGAKDYLLSKGFPEERILLEDKSYSTLQNIENAREIIKEKGNDPEEAKIVIVSAYYHLFRADYLARKLGFREISTAGGNGMWILFPHNCCREFFAYSKEQLFFLSGRNR